MNAEPNLLREVSRLAAIAAECVGDVEEIAPVRADSLRLQVRATRRAMKETRRMHRAGPRMLKALNLALPLLEAQERQLAAQFGRSDNAALSAVCAAIADAQGGDK